MFDFPAQCRQVVEGNRGEHVVLHVILHVPVEKSDEWAARVGAAAEPEIRGVGCQPDVLRSPGQSDQPTAIKVREIHDQNKNPIAGGDEKDRQGQLADQDHAGPVPVPPAKLRVGFRHDLLHPRFAAGKQADAFQIPERIFHPGAQRGENQHRIRKWRELPKPEFKCVPVNLLRKDDLAIVVVKRGNLMVLYMADAEADRIAPSDKGKEIHEKIVQPLPAKRSLVNQFMNCHQAHEGTAGSVQE